MVEIMCMLAEFNHNGGVLEIIEIFTLINRKWFQVSRNYCKQLLRSWHHYFMCRNVCFNFFFIFSTYMSDSDRCHYLVTPATFSGRTIDLA